MNHGLQFDAYGYGLAHMDQVGDCGRCKGKGFLGPEAFPVPCVECEATGKVVTTPQQ